jgi:hypothetical protein
MMQSEAIARMTDEQRAAYNDLHARIRALQTGRASEPKPTDADYAEYWQKRREANRLELQASAMLEAAGCEMSRPYRP